jgi:hypothetical protein
MYTPRLEELESRDLLNSSISPHLLSVMRSDATPVTMGGYRSAAIVIGGYPAAPAEQPFAKDLGGHGWAAGFGLPPGGAAPLGFEAVSVAPFHFEEVVEITVPQAVAEFHVRVPEVGAGASVVAPAVAAVANETLTLAPTSPVVRTNGPSLAATQPSPDINHAAGASGIEAASVGIAQRLTTPPVPRPDTLGGLTAIRVDASNGPAVRNNGILAIHESEAAAMPEAAPVPTSVMPSLTLPRASGPDSAAADTMPPLPLPQGTSVLSALPALDVTALERAMQHFLRQLHGAGDERAGSRDKPGLGVWLVAGTAAAAACEIARRQLRASRRELAVQWNWIAGAPPDHSFGH